MSFKHEHFTIISTQIQNFNILHFIELTEVLTKQFVGSLKGIILLSLVVRVKCGVNKMSFPFSRRDAASRTLIHMKQRPRHTADCGTALVMLTPHPAKPPLSQRPRKYLISHHFRSKRCLPPQSRRSREKFDLEMWRDSILDGKRSQGR